VKIGPVVSAENRLTDGNCVACSRGLAYLVEYLRIYWTDFRNLFTIWKLYVQMMDLYLIFQFVKECCHGNQWEKWESNEGGLIPPVFFALAFANELEYHYLYVRINSRDDQATSDINLVGFWTVPPEFNCVEQVSISDRVSIFTLARWQHGCLASTC